MKTKSNTKFPATLEEYKQEVDRRANDRFCIGNSDLFCDGWDDHELVDAFNSKTPIKQLLEEKREELDLIERLDWR